MTDKLQDRPPIPRPKRPRVATAMIVFSVLVIGGYSAMAFTQRELGEPDREEVPKSVAEIEAVIAEGRATREPLFA